MLEQLNGALHFNFRHRWPQSGRFAQSISLKIGSIMVLTGALACNQDILLTPGELTLLEDVTVTVVN